MPSAIWTAENDWRNARAESGVIHRDFGDRVGTEIAQGTDLLPQGPVDWFGHGTSQPIVQNMRQMAVYDATADKTFVVWQGRQLRPYATSYDHALGAWGPIVEISTVTLTDDDHGAPQICQDASGYLHVFWGTHGNAIEYAISTTARDISAWTVQADISGNWSYQQPFVVGGNIWLYGRVTVGSGPTHTISLRKSNGVASGHTWAAETVLCNFDGRMMYSSDGLVNGNDLHLTWWLRTDPFGPSYNIYYGVYETDTGLFKTAAGTTHGALPISEATGDTYYSAFDSGTQEANAPVLWLDSGGLPHLAYIHDNTTTVDVYHTRWTGSAWTTPVSLGSGTSLWMNPAVVVTSDTSAAIYWMVAGNASIKKTTWNPSDDTGISTATWFTNSDWTPEGVRLLLGPVSIRDSHANLRMLVCEYFNEVWWYEYCRIAAHGDSGFVQAPAWRQDAYLALPMNEDAGAGTLVDYSGRAQNASNSGLVMGVAGVLGLTGAQLGSAREATIPHVGGQWFFGFPCVIRFWGVDLINGILGKGRPFNSNLRYAIRIDAGSGTGSIRVINNVDGTFLSAISSATLNTSGFHLYEISYDGAGTVSFFTNGSAIGTSTAITHAKFTQGLPTNALDIGYWYNSGGVSTSKHYGSGVLQGLVMLPRYQSTLAEHQAFWAALTAGSFTSKWKAVA